jgi:hypothetical protein
MRLWCSFFLSFLIYLQPKRGYSEREQRGRCGLRAAGWWWQWQWQWQWL